MSGELSTAVNGFTTSLYQELCHNSKGNLIFSPFSLHTVLGMLGVGAEGETREEILEALGFDEEDDNSEIGESYNDALADFQKFSKPSTFSLLTASRIYSQADFAIKDEYADRLEDDFLAELEQMDFSTAIKCKGAATQINKWVEAQTKNKIKDLLSPSDLAQDKKGNAVGLVLLNAIYFKGNWMKKFDQKKTKKEDFKLTSSKTVKVDMMNLTESFPFVAFPNLDADALVLPYKGGRLSMVIILPKAVNGLQKLQSSIGKILQGEKSLGKRTTTKLVRVKLPKFRIEASIENLSDMLMEIGMESMFSEKEADFGGICDDPKQRMYVKKVIQKAFIEVNEEGAEAAAATAAVCVPTATKMKRKPAVTPFIVDHPFYFQIVDSKNGDLVLFSGHCNDPSK